jgi:hypothetical protein
MGGACRTYGGTRNNLDRKVQSEDMKRPLQRGRPKCRIILSCILENYNISLWIGLIWLRRAASSGLL